MVVLPAALRACAIASAFDSSASSVWSRKYEMGCGKCRGGVARKDVKISREHKGLRAKCPRRKIGYQIGKTGGSQLDDGRETG